MIKWASDNFKKYLTYNVMVLSRSTRVLLNLSITKEDQIFFGFPDLILNCALNSAHQS